MKLKHHSHLFYIGLILLLPLKLFAFEMECQKTQRKIIDNLRQLSLEELFNLSVNVSTQTPHTASKAPSTITVFTQQELRNMGINHLEELFNFIPGFQATREVVGGVGYNISNRGVSLPQASYHLLFMIDGQRINNDFSGGALMPNRFMPVDNIKQVEIIRGPGSALYGTSAFSGVINVVTDTKSRFIHASSGHLNRKKIAAQLCQEWGEHRISIFAQHDSDDGDHYQGDYIQQFNPNILDTRDKRSGEDVYLSYRWQDKLTLNIRHNQRDLNGFFIRQSVNDEINQHQSTQSFVHLDYRLINKTPWQVNLKAGYLATQQQRQMEDSPGTVLDLNIKEKEWHIGIDSHYQINAQHRLLAGVTFRQAQVNQASQDTYQERVYLTSSALGQLGNRNIWGVYLQDEYQINDRWQATLGIRHDRDQYTSNSMSPRMALIYQTDFDAQFKWLYGKAFRAPSVRQLSSALGNPELRPETIRTFEMAWIQSMQQWQSVVTYFHSRYSDPIDTIVINGGLSRRQFNNLDNFSTAGWEFELTGEVIENMSLRLNYSYLHKMKQPTRRSAKQLFSAALNYQWQDWNLNLSAYYMDDMQQDIFITGQGFDVVTLNDYWVLNSHLRYSWSKELHFYAHVDNLLDEAYASATKMTTFTEGVPHRGRTYQLGVEFLF